MTHKSLILCIKDFKNYPNLIQYYYLKRWLRGNIKLIKGFYKIIYKDATILIYSKYRKKKYITNVNPDWI